MVPPLPSPPPTFKANQRISAPLDQLPQTHSSNTSDPTTEPTTKPDPASYPAPKPFSINQATSPSSITAIKHLFAAYKEWLDLDLSYQNYAAELAGLPGNYAPPGGCLLLARGTATATASADGGLGGGECEDGDEDTGEVLGCVALRPLPSHSHSQSTAATGLPATTTSTTPTPTPTPTPNTTTTTNKPSPSPLLLLPSTSTKTCELKRLYVCPSARGSGVARALLRAALSEAKKAGYERCVLDTLMPRMEGAVRLYEGEGFRGCAAYYESPVVGTVFLGLDLGGWSEGRTGQGKGEREGV